MLHVGVRHRREDCHEGLACQGVRPCACAIGVAVQYRPRIVGDRIIAEAVRVESLPLVYAKIQPRADSVDPARVEAMTYTRAAIAKELRWCLKSRRYFRGFLLLTQEESRIVEEYARALDRWRLRAKQIRRTA